MKANKVLLLSLAVFALGANAAPVSIETAKHAAGSWALSNASLGVRHGASVSAAAAHDVDGTPGFYAVSLQGGGTVFLAADDEMGPVLAFTAESAPDLSAKSPLLNLLNRDIAARRKQLAAQAASTPTVSFAASGVSSSAAATAGGAAASKSKKLWAALTSSAGQSAGGTSGGLVKFGATASPRSALSSSEIRVDPLLKSQWSQQEAGGNPCYNYYTPRHFPCGCVATAAGQILNRWQWPQEELPKFSNSCKVSGVSQTLDSVGETRLYKWDAMVPTPNATTSEEGRMAIGALLYDLGVSFGAEYDASGTSAYDFNVAAPLHSLFNCASAYTYTVNGTGQRESGLHTAPVRQRAILANLDAKRPVELYIISDVAGGHAVVADGYGYVTISDEEVEFTHINMGWAGTDDMWYNLPVISTAEAGAQAGQSGGYEFNFLMGATFNIHPTETGDILSGRVIDDGDPVADATVEVREAGSSEVLQTTVSDTHGIYSFVLPGGKDYVVSAVTADGKKNGTTEEIHLKSTTASGSTYTTSDDNDIGNSWGNDIDVVVPHVRIVGEKDYPNLNTALEAAATMENAIIEIFGPTRLKKPITITASLTIRTVPGPSADYPNPTLEDCVVLATDAAVTEGGWALQVADDVRVDFSDFVLGAESGEPLCLDVLAGGKVSFAGRIDVGTVVTRTADAFIIAGLFEPVEAGLGVSYSDVTDRYSQFGTYECSADDAAACAGLVFNVLDTTLIGSVGENGTLVWDRVNIDPSIAVVYATDDTIGVTYYLSVDLLFKDYTNGAEVVFLRDCPANMFTNAVSVTKSVSIRSEGDEPFVATLGKSAGFTVVGDAELVFTNIVFTRTAEFSSESFVKVRDGASLVLSAGALISNLKFAGSSASAVYVEKGSVVMQDGSAIKSCVASRSATCKSAGVYLKGADCLFDFAGGTITECAAQPSTGGGAVYAERNAMVLVSGSASAYENTAGGKTRNVYVPGADSLVLSGGLTGGEIGVYCYGGTASGKPFATVGDGVTPDLVSEHFRNDSNASLFAEVSDDGATLVWAEEPPGPKSVPEDEAEARIVVGESTAAYSTISNAFEAAVLHDAQAIELLRDASLSNSLSVVSSMVLDGCGFTLSRAGEFCISVTNADASLTVTNLVLSGGEAEGRMLDVHWGQLVLEADTVISGVTGSAESMVAPIVVWDGSLVMKPGVEISDCVNSYEPPPGGALTAGAIVVNGPNAIAELLGGTITGCTGARAGGVTVANGAEVRVSGDLKVRGNKLVSGEDSNLVVHDKSNLVLAGLLVGRVGFTEGVNGDTNVFGTVDADFLSSTTPSNLVVSARRFRHDLTSAKGMVATNETEAVLVWSSSVGDSSVFTNVVGDVTNVYDVVIVEVDDDDPEIVECLPFAFVSIEEVSDGKWKLTLKPGTERCVYTLKSSDDLETWTAVGEPKELSAADISGEELEFFFEVDAAGGKRFWKVEGADGIE